MGLLQNVNTFRKLIFEVKLTLEWPISVAARNG